MIIAPTALPSVIITVTVVITPSTPDVAAAGRRPAGRVSPPHTAQLTPQLAGRLRLGLHHRVQPQAPHPPPRVPARVCRLPPPAPAHTAAASNSPSASQSPPVQTTSSRAHSYASSPTSAPPSETSSTSPVHASCPPRSQHAVPKTSSPTCPTTSPTSSLPRPNGPCGTGRGPSTRRIAVHAAPTIPIVQSWVA